MSKTINTVFEQAFDEQLIGMAVHASSCGLTIADARQPDMPLVFVNKTFEKITGYHCNEVLGKNCRFLQGHHAQQEEITQIKSSLVKHKPCTVTLLNVKKSGEPFYNELHISPLCNADGEVTHFVGVQTDVTEKVHLQQAVLERKVSLEQMIEERTNQLHTKNSALQEIVSQIEHEKNKIKENVDANIEAMVLPIVHDLRRKMALKDKHLLDVLEQRLSSLVSPLGRHLSERHYQLSRKEMEVCALVANGLSSKHIADFFSISPSTVENQRNNIRKKLGISGTSVNLECFLRSLTQTSERASPSLES